MTLAERILELRPHALRDAKIEALAQEVLDLQEDLARLTKARAAALAGGAPQTAIEAASSLWPVTVGGGFPAVVDTIAAAVLAERVSCAEKIATLEMELRVAKQDLAIERGGDARAVAAAGRAIPYGGEREAPYDTHETDIPQSERAPRR